VLREESGQAQGGTPGPRLLKFKPPRVSPAEDFESMLQISEEVVAFIQQNVDEKNRKGS
jgi:hypothetical protein